MRPIDFGTNQMVLSRAHMSALASQRAANTPRTSVMPCITWCNSARIASQPPCRTVRSERRTYADKVLI